MRSNEQRAVEAARAHETVTVLVVGGGPAGLTSALLLARAGVDVLLLERRNFTSHFPRAHLLNVRTMEVFHEVGVADDIYALSPPDDRWHRVCWYTSLAGPSHVHGRKIGEVFAWGGGPDRPRYAQASPRPFANLPQIRLDRLLWEHADARCPGKIRAGQEVVDLTLDDEEGEDGVVATVVDRDSGESYRVRAQYVIAADGGRVCAELLGVEFEGPRAILEVTSLYVAADLERYADEEALITFFISPAGQGGPTGAIQALGPERWANESTEWAFGMRAIGSATPVEELLPRVRDMLGIDDLEVEIKAISRWQYEGVVAERFRVGRVFLVGDAAHRHPPTGGLGLNTAVQDVSNLCWKLVAVLRGYASDALLDTYESERRPIAAYNVQHSLLNAGRHLQIAAAMGLESGQSEEEGWRQIEIWASDSPEGARRRAATDAAVAANAEDYSQLNVEAGFAYDLGAVIQDGTPPPPEHDSPIVFVPTARPGHHVPHVWLEHAGDRISTVDLVEREGFTLFVSGASEESWRAAAAAAGERSGCPLSVVAVGGQLGDPEGAWAAVRGVGDSGVALVRPDRHVAWRADPAPAERPRELEQALRQLLHGGVEARNTAHSLLAGIERAASELRR